ncbi:gliding motility-associated ABC transporter substrate-binding protein GldG [Myroides odoratimimus]|uniref:Gliding-associated putative ABC transporter substrate-binding component GldG n=1 Tax=Myroides odoratimimus CIP 101113 TaxID=883154 RepID=A0AAV3F3Z6_9FLAO|nr:gliding motility-associated ABC transporter substrate-binding protein GldG [Myroides odoratimimus]EHO12558.1 gliding-associated putative ABC transporter substrate-binding component GldG [Myroides odoratimimus CIP 101113]MDM1459438.1 gliding motility-associated ABC transporter substrate-binding protein GldG [Myroides odoratimimus]MDO5858718.1 gliding motility-associated ABC transporter substrate-binding protein GldG [Myroides odoratimimus]SHL30286.1 protein involved in gliding motility GldG [
MKKFQKRDVKLLVRLLVVLVIINVISALTYTRFDFTQDQRYTLSKSTVGIVDNVQDLLIVDVFLKGNFPLEFRRLQNETKQLLEEIQSRNENIKFRFIDPNEEGANKAETLEQLYEYGLKPVTITVTDKGAQSQQLVFPWALVSQGEKVARVQLLKNMMGANTEEKVISSVQHLEYALAEAISKVTTDKNKKIAILKGNGELDDAYIADFLMTLRETYHLAPFTLESVSNEPQKTLDQLKEFDLAIIAKPTKAFSEEQVGVLDQFVMNGGKTMWLLDQVQADFDSLRSNGTMLAYNKDQSLGELLFRYGIRINPVLVKDEISTKIKLASGRQGSETVYTDFLWKFAPFVYPDIDHPIVKNIEGVKYDFTSPIDTLKNGVKKTILAKSSKYSSLVGVPGEISFNVLKEEVTPEFYEGKGNYILGVLLEGEFPSVFKNRVFPFGLDKPISESRQTQMIVISDGDIIRNQLDDKGMPLELGYDKWTNMLYGNKELLVNSVNYLLDDTGLINLRTKEVKIPMLDKVSVEREYTSIQMKVLVIPIALVVVFGTIFILIRKRKFNKK